MWILRRITDSGDREKYKCRIKIGREYQEQGVGV